MKHSLISSIENVTMHCAVIIYVYFMVNKPFEFEFEFEMKKREKVKMLCSAL